MFDETKRVVVGATAMKHGIDRAFISEAWAGESIDGFAVERLPPHEEQLIVIRYISRPEGILEMIAEDRVITIMCSMLS